MFKLLAVLALCGVALSQRNPNPCLGKTGQGFVNDYGQCPNYFWCNGEAAFIADPCPDLFVFDTTASSCTTDTTVCLECPLTGTIAVSLKNISNQMVSRWNVKCDFLGSRFSRHWLHHIPVLSRRHSRAIGSFSLPNWHTFQQVGSP
jgi:hypothetical protein